MKDPSKKRQPCMKKREIAKLFLTVIRLINYLWLAYKLINLFDNVVAFWEQITGPLDHYFQGEV